MILLFLSIKKELAFLLTPYLKVIPKRFERLTHALEGAKLNHSLHIASQFISFELFFTFDKPFDN
jgi:hypothetical protein